MSYPESSLKRFHRTPLPGKAQAGRTLTNPSNPITNAIAREISRTPNDADLVSSMATRLATVERELLNAKREIVEKNEYIQRLEEQIDMHQLSQANQPILRLEKRCQKLQKQVEEMEEFLNDYGMIWVGKDEATSHSSLWHPQSSYSHNKVDFDLIVRNIRELNIVAGEDSAAVVHTGSGGRLKVPDPIPLTLYENGIFMFNGPFRPYSDPATMHFIQDLMDGYFPSELQPLYPEGVPFKLNDQRSAQYTRPLHHKELFPGDGTRLDGQPSPKKAPSVATPSPKGTQTETSGTANPHSPPVPLDKFLSQLTHHVIKGGRVINIHDEITETLQESSKSNVTLVETPVLQELKQRLDLDEESRPPTPGKLVTLRIKTETGDETYILKMKSTDTIGDVRKHIHKLRSSRSFLIKTAYPPRTYSQDSETLDACGFYPTANLYLATPTKKA